MTDRQIPPPMRPEDYTAVFQDQMDRMTGGGVNAWPSPSSDLARIRLPRRALPGYDTQPIIEAGDTPDEARGLSPDQSDIIAYLWRTPLGQALRRQEMEEPAAPTSGQAIRARYESENRRSHTEQTTEYTRELRRHARRVEGLTARIAELEAENAALRAAAGYSTDNSPALGGGKGER